jgi:hypothetical protein
LIILIIFSEEYKVMKLLGQFSPAYYYLIPLWSKYSPQHPTLKYFQSMIFQQYGCRKPIALCGFN